MPDVSVIIPTYNRAKLLGRAVHSVLSQTFADFELIIVDDCSTDNTEEMIRGLTDKRIKFIRHEENRGAPAARNTGIKNARGAFIAFLDSDDEWSPQKLEKQIELFLHSSPSTGVVYAKCQVINEIRNEIIVWDFNLRGNLYHNFLKEPFLDFITPLIKRECFNKIGLMDENVLAYQEWDTFLRISQYYEFDFVPEILTYYYIHRDEAISRSTLRATQGYNYIVEKHKIAIRKNAGRKTLSAHYSFLYSSYMKTRSYSKAFSSSVLAFAVFPKKLIIMPMNKTIMLLNRTIKLLTKIRDFFDK